ncbi:hypothetical protein SBA5_490021 [Candidatus Sulfotelmatomonas gaucii]|uniref:Uncharacterized protein n=1 Tax=Candidatus Sulfuritelmatomonas gaucii TaxID=2043161 RepID=A0A2N9LPQ4_9BACT|nr:hypothetical protein SBA5_490021 [Candidatus Sulfotelmatomonas gaucii]
MINPQEFSILSGPDGYVLCGLNVGRRPSTSKAQPRRFGADNFREVKVHRRIFGKYAQISRLTAVEPVYKTVSASN